MRGVEVGNIFKLGTRYSEAFNCTYLNRNGKTQPIQMGSYGIGIGRLLACIVEEHHDENGIIWPISVAPYHVHLVSLGQNQVADQIFTQLNQKAVEVLYDDREQSPGVKFNDADLIGIPIRITVSEKALSQGRVEIKLRHQQERKIIQIPDLETGILAEMRILEDEIKTTNSYQEYSG
ncbi:MAG: His/Gly/Thr/Pro-type tRNA ligase C-terminal domain-containing protein [Chloroflexota bacterium]